MTTPTPTISIPVDVTNPGQFFACCGLLELASRVRPKATAYFENGRFVMSTAGGTLDPLGDLAERIAQVELKQLDPADDFASPVCVGVPFDVHLDWWGDERDGGKALKVWAGSMRNVRIARAMQQALQNSAVATDGMLDHGVVVYDPDAPNKKVEPFYFDARRGRNAQAVDVGFSTDSLSMTTAAYPAVEFLCLVGLQRFRPMPTDTPRVFDYWTWAVPLPPVLAAAAVCGKLSDVGAVRYRFENAFRTDQRKHKGFMPATRIGEER